MIDNGLIQPAVSRNVGANQTSFYNFFQKANDIKLAGLQLVSMCDITQNIMFDK